MQLDWDQFGWLFMKHGKSCFTTVTRAPNIHWIKNQQFTWQLRRDHQKRHNKVIERLFTNEGKWLQAHRAFSLFFFIVRAVLLITTLWNYQRFGGQTIANPQFSIFTSKLSGFLHSIHVVRDRVDGTVAKQYSIARSYPLKVTFFLTLQTTQSWYFWHHMIETGTH